MLKVDHYVLAIYIFQLGYCFDIEGFEGYVCYLLHIKLENMHIIIVSCNSVLDNSDDRFQVS
jgi:hypothetical protein